MTYDSVLLHSILHKEKEMSFKRVHTGILGASIFCSYHYQFEMVKIKEQNIYCKVPLSEKNIFFASKIIC